MKVLVCGATVRSPLHVAVMLLVVVGCMVMSCFACFACLEILVCETTVR
jgi:hypothetical protein